MASQISVVFFPVCIDYIMELKVPYNSQKSPDAITYLNVHCKFFLSFQTGVLDICAKPGILMQMNIFF